MRVACFLALFLLSCGGTAPPVQTSASDGEAEPSDPVLDEVMREQASRRGARSQPAARFGRDEGAGRDPRATSRVGVHGITGTLTAYEVEQAMAERHEELLSCVKERPRKLGHVSGTIAFQVAVDAQGKVEQVDIAESDLGYTPLEACLSAVLSTTPFPVPAGAQRAEAKWRMGVEPLARPAEWIDAEALEPVIERQAEATYEHCKIDPRQRFVVNGYVGLSHKLHPVSVRLPRADAAPSNADDAEQTTCLSHELQQWNGWPKARAVSKVGFELHWVAAPPKKRGRPALRAKGR